LRFMTKEFTKLEQFEKYMVTHLYSLYDEIMKITWEDIEFEYMSGSIDTTEHYLIKCGVDFMAQNQYEEMIEDDNWKRA
jgi:hypothetical protein